MIQLLNFKSKVTYLEAAPDDLGRVLKCSCNSGTASIVRGAGLFLQATYGATNCHGTDKTARTVMNRLVNQSVFLKKSPIWLAGTNEETGKHC